ncbi:hypothetical protein Tco_0480654 [Tanacetum coccineum]
MSKKRLIDDEINDITNDLSYKIFRGEKIDDEYERDCEIKIKQLLQDYSGLDIEMQKKERVLMEEKYLAASQRIKSVCNDEDDSIPLRDIIARYSPSVAITSSPSVLPTKEPVDSLIMGDEHLNTIPEKESDELIKSICDHFTTFSNPLLDSNDDFSSDDESLSEEEIPKEEFKNFSNPLYDLDDEIITNENNLLFKKNLDEIIPIPLGIDEPCFNAESDLLESLLNHDSLIDSTKIDFIFDGFSLPRPPEIPSSQSFSQIPMEEIDLFMYPIPCIISKLYHDI